MHVLLFNDLAEKERDHVNMDGLDNRCVNLRKGLSTIVLSMDHWKHPSLKEMENESVIKSTVTIPQAFLVCHMTPTENDTVHTGARVERIDRSRLVMRKNEARKGHSKRRVPIAKGWLKGNTMTEWSTARKA